MGTLIKIVSSALAILCLASALYAEDDRLFVNAKVNSQEVRLVLDTGAPMMLGIFRPTAERLSLKTRKEEGQEMAKVGFSGSSNVYSD